MRTLTVAALVGSLLTISTLGCSQSKTKMLLTDTQMDEIRAGTDLCPLLGINGPCVGSLLQVYDPALPSNPSCGTLPGATTNCFSSLSAYPLPQSGSVTVQTALEGTLSLWGVHVSSDAAHPASVLLIALALAACAIVMGADRRRWARGEAATILARYRYLMVGTDEIPSVGSRSMLQVGSVRDLVRLAKLHDELIVHADRSGRHRFALFTDSVVYVYDAAPAARPVGRLALATA